MTFFIALRIGEDGSALVLPCDAALAGREGGQSAWREGGREEMGTLEDPGGGVSSGLREITLWGMSLIPLSEAVESSLLPPRPPSLPGFAPLETPPLVDSGPLPRSQRLEKEKGAKKRAVKEFLFSRKGTLPRDLVNIKLKGQAREG